MANIRILVIVPRLGHVMIMTHGCSYTCITKEIDNELMFKFKGNWHRVSDYTTPDTVVSNV